MPGWRAVVEENECNLKNSAKGDMIRGLTVADVIINMIFLWAIKLPDSLNLSTK